MGIRIDALDPTVLPSVLHEIAAMKDGLTVKLTIQQISGLVAAALVDSAPVTLDTLNELAAALGDDPNFAATMATALGLRIRVDAAQSFNAAQKLQAQSNIGLVLDTDVARAVGMRGQLHGLTTSNNTTDPTNDIDVALGMAASSDAIPSILTLAAPMTKRLDAAWASGSGNGGCMSAAAIADTTYHLHLIGNPTTGAVDWGFDVSATAPNLPSGYTKFRRFWSILREGGAIVPYKQFGDVCHRDTPKLEYASTVSFAAALKSWAVPLGIVVEPQITFYIQPAASSNIYLAMGDAIAGSADCIVLEGRTDTGGVTEVRQWVNGGFFTNLNAQTYFQHNILSGTAAVNTNVNSKGWIDDRGRNA